MLLNKMLDIYVVLKLGVTQFWRLVCLFSSDGMN